MHCSTTRASAARRGRAARKQEVPGRIPGTSRLTLVVERTSWTDERAWTTQLHALSNGSRQSIAASMRWTDGFDAVDRGFDRVDDPLQPRLDRVCSGAQRDRRDKSPRRPDRVGLVGVFLAQTIAVIVA